jgi:cobalt-zinc-cadmium efflux system membrane fusion protein
MNEAMMHPAKQTIEPPSLPAPFGDDRAGWAERRARVLRHMLDTGRNGWRIGAGWEGWHDGRRWIVWGALAVAAGLLALGISARSTEQGLKRQSAIAAAQRSEDAPRVSPDGTRVHLGDRYSNTIRIVPVDLFAFHAVKEAVGQIAFNDNQSTLIFSPYSGRVVRLIANPGDRVSRGDPLFEIASPDVVQVQSDYIAAVNQNATARRLLEVARRNAERQTDLYQAKAVSQRDYDQAQADQQTAESNVSTTSGQMRALQDKLRLMGKTEEFIHQLQTERRIDPITAIFSPISGTVTSRKVGPGQYVQPDNTNALYTVADLTTMWLRVNVPETDIRFVKMGQQVQVGVMAYPNESFTARITYIGVSIDPATRRVPVRAEMPNPDFRLKPEMFATARIISAEAMNSPAVPVNAIVRDGAAARVWVQAGPGEFIRRTVQLGIQQDGMVQITEGVKAGERVVSDGAVFLGNILPGGNG